MKSVILICLISILCLGIAPFIGLTSYSDDAIYFWQLRVPRLLAGLAVGATLGLTGAAFQALFGNPLATPSNGTTAGARWRTCALLLFNHEGWMQEVGASPFAFIGAMCISIPIAYLRPNGHCI